MFGMGGRAPLRLLLDLAVLIALRGTAAVCSNSCAYAHLANNGICEDGGPGSESSACELGFDCLDCGDSERTGPPSPPPLCEDSCSYSYGRSSIDAYRDGECDDGGPGSEYSYCDPGTDCTDCTGRLYIEPVWRVVIGVVGGMIVLVCLVCCLMHPPCSRQKRTVQHLPPAAHPAAELQPAVEPPSGGGGPSIAIAPPMAAAAPAYTPTPVTVPSAASAPTPVVQGSVVAAAPPGGNLSAQLAKLADLRAAGQLTEAEFTAAKEKVLSA